MHRLTVVSEDRGEKREVHYSCGHFNVTIRSEDCYAVTQMGESPGITLELLNHLPAADGSPPRKQLLVEIVLPRDGRVVYVANDRGDTVNKYEWPLKPRRSELKTMPAAGDDELLASVGRG